MAEERVCRARLVRTLTSDRLALRSEDGLLPIETVLSMCEFEAGDLLEVRLLERCPDFGISTWVKNAKRG